MKTKQRWHLISALHPIIVDDSVPSPTPEFEISQEPRTVDGIDIVVPISHVVTPPIDKTLVDDLSIENLTKLGVTLRTCSSTLVPDRLQSCSVLSSAGDVIENNVVVPLNNVDNEETKNSLE